MSCIGGFTVFLNDHEPCFRDTHAPSWRFSTSRTNVSIDDFSSCCVLTLSCRFPSHGCFVVYDLFSLSLSLSLSRSVVLVVNTASDNEQERYCSLSLDLSIGRARRPYLSLLDSLCLPASISRSLRCSVVLSLSLSLTHIHTHTQTIVLSWRQYGLRRLLLNLLDSVANVFLGSTLPHHAAQRCAAPLGTARHAISLFPRSLSCFDLAWKSNEQKPPQQPERSLRCSCHAGFASQLQVICHRHHPRAPCLCQYLLL